MPHFFSCLTSRRRSFSFLAAAAALTCSLALFACRNDDAASREKLLAPTPPAGWNSFQSYGCYIYDEPTMKNLDAFIEKLKPYGYEYFVLDNGWFGEYAFQGNTHYPANAHARDINVDSYGFVLPSKVNFPDGLDAFIKKCRKNNVKFGVHMMRGIPQKAVRLNLPIKGTPYHAQDVANTKSVSSWCDYTYGVDMDKPGAQAWYDGLMAHLSELGVDFVKFDDMVQHPREVQAVCDAIAKLPRPMVLSLSPGDGLRQDNGAWDVYHQAQMLRVTADVWDNQVGLDRCFNAWRKWGKNRVPGFWIDMDMIPFGQLQLMAPKRPGMHYDGLGNTRECQLSQGQMRTLITLRALSASPLFVGGDLPTMDDFSLSLLCNEDMLACNRNGVSADLLADTDHVELWRAALNDKPEEGYIGLFNRNKKKEQSFTLDISRALGCPRATLYDVWNKKTFKKVQSQTFVIPPNDVIFLRYKKTR